MAALRRNLELKALDPDPARTLAACLELGAQDRGLLHQRDTYFHAVQGRLKLREAPPARRSSSPTSAPIGPAPASATTA